MKRQFKFVLSVLLFSFVFGITACSSSSNVNSSDVTNALSISTTEVEITFQGTPELKPTSEVIIAKTFSIYFPEELLLDETSVELLNGQIQKFNQSSPDIQIDYRVKENSEESSIFDFLEKAYLAAPQALPDLIILPRGMMEEAAQQGYILPIDDEKLELFSDDNLYPYAKQMAQVDGVYYGVPFLGDLMLMVVKENQQALNKWTDVLSSGKTLRAPLSDPDSLLTFLFYESLEGEITLNQGYVSLDEVKLAQVFGFYQEALRQGVMPVWLTQFESYSQLWTESVGSTSDNLITWYSYYANGYIDAFAAEFIPTESGVDLTYADGYVICVPAKNEEFIDEKLEIANSFSESEFIAYYAKALNMVPISSASLTFWGESKNAAVVSYLAPNAKLIPSQKIINEVGGILSLTLPKILKNEIEISEALSQISEALQP